MKSHYCADCVIAWYPYQAKERCPVCGSGVHIRQEPASPEAVERYQATRPDRLRTGVPAFDPGAIAEEIASLPTFTGERRFAA